MYKFDKKYVGIQLYIHVIDATKLEDKNYFDELEFICNNLVKCQAHPSSLGNTLLVVTKMDLIENKEECKMQWRQKLATLIPVTQYHQIIFVSAKDEQYKETIDYVFSKAMINVYCRGFILQYEKLLPLYQSRAEGRVKKSFKQKCILC